MSKKKAHILIVDDDPDVLYTAQLLLKREYSKVSTENSPVRLESLLKKEDVDILLLDMNFKVGATSGNEGLFWLQKVQQLRPQTLVIMHTAYGDIQLAVECMKNGALDFLVKPWEKEQLTACVHTAYQLMQSEQKIKKLENREEALSAYIASSHHELIAKSAAMKKVLETIDKVAETDASVLLLGENGTGKDLIAYEIHKRSNRTEEQMIKVDVGALPESLFESELFGHTKGAFTDAKDDRTGRIEVADGGTLFLDEIGNISPVMQMKLLSVLQNRTLTPVGSSKVIPFDVRLICATNSPLYELVNSGDFRQDLLYRINTVEIYLPPLRERKDDIKPLLNYFLDLYSKKYQKEKIKIDAKASKQLLHYTWPGNIRELQHAVERAVIMAEDGLITADLLLPSQKSTPQPVGSLKVEDVERNAIVKAITSSGGNLSQAAEILGIGRTTLYRKMEKYNI